MRSNPVSYSISRDGILILETPINNPTNCAHINIDSLGDEFGINIAANCVFHHTKTTYLYLLEYQLRDEQGNIREDLLERIQSRVQELSV